MPSRDLAPKVKVTGLRKRIEAFAQAHGLFINEKNAWKITWMSNHEGRCYCDWQNRRCPCHMVMQDLHRFNGRCLCRVLWTKEALEKQQKIKRKPSKKKTAADKVADRKKQKQNVELFKKLFQK